MKYTDFIVPGAPEACLAKVEGYLRSNEWNYPGAFSRPVAGGMIQFMKPRRTLIDSPLGWLILIGLSLITAGLFLGVYFFYWLIFRSDYGADMQIIAALESSRETRLTVRTDTPEYAEKIKVFVESELINNRAVAWSVDKTDSEEEDIPAQIQALANLRDKGIITTEQFDSKRSELLDKM